MTDRARRQFLKAASLGLSAAMLPPSIRAALAVEPARRNGTIKDVEHVIILMQENRSFDHYFGTLRGVRGFSDPHPITLPGGKPVWHQPAKHGQTLSPFRWNTKSTSALICPSLDHSFKKSHDTWKHHDAWVVKKGEMTMGYFTREDLPFYYALADAFTICDAYHCSVFGPTNPNRMYLWTGTSGLSAGNDGAQVIANPDDETNGTADPAQDAAKFKPYSWTTYAERLEAAGISWKVFQEYDNFGDNSLAYFQQFRNLNPSSSLYKRGRTWSPGSGKNTGGTSHGEFLVAEMEAAIKAGTLPQVSWVVASAMLSEHPATSSPAYGEIFVSKLLAMLAAHPEVWSKTVLFINYDENDGLFDHMPLPVPAIDPSMGKSTVEAAGEIYHGVPMGVGPRVPMLIVSPWSKGGFVNSELFDHTSVLRFLEARFGVAEPNITPWRRSVCGDLTSAFDFAASAGSWNASLPDTSGYASDIQKAKKLPETKPVYGRPVPRQENGRRLARPLPYDFHVDAKQHTGSIKFEFHNPGAAGVCFIVYAEGEEAGPWFYTVEAGKSLEDFIKLTGADYHFTVRGPNGFFRAYKGNISNTAVHAAFAAEGDAVTLTLTNAGSGEQTVSIADNYAAGMPHSLMVAPGGTASARFDIAPNDHWYDLAVAAGAQSFRFAGHVETGKISRSDPAL